MKKIIKEQFPYKLNDIRIVKKFLWIPKTLPIKEKTSGSQIKRWFERVEIAQQLQNEQDGWHIWCNTLLPTYKPVWIDKWWNDIDIIVEM